MTDLTIKEELLENSGYRYHFDRMMYINRAARRAFSLEFVEDHSQQEIRRLLETPAASQEATTPCAIAAFMGAASDLPDPISRQPNLR
jgi:hypothetical protein